MHVFLDGCCRAPCPCETKHCKFKQLKGKRKRYVHIGQITANANDLRMAFMFFLKDWHCNMNQTMIKCTWTKNQHRRRVHGHLFFYQPKDRKQKNEKVEEQEKKLNYDCKSISVLKNELKH